jgi:hypothetical protein
MVLEKTAFGEDGAEDAADTFAIERSGVALDDAVEDVRLSGFIGDGQAVFTLQAGNLRDGLSAEGDEAEKFEINFVDGIALGLKGLSHGGLSFQNGCKNTKAAI